MKTCLIVDDSHVVRKVMMRIITNLGMKGIEAENGQEAADICMQEMPDCILLDWYMPVMSGADALATIRTLRDGEEPKIIIVTSESNPDIIDRAIDMGADEFITKPFDTAMIRALLEANDVLVPENEHF
jgi:two-component system chemotaxis response regulator CheY